jgi:hypothetical protein
LTKFQKLIRLYVLLTLAEAAPQKLRS